MANALQGKHIAGPAADGIERVELDRLRDAVSDAAVDVYDALPLRGGTANPDKLRIAEAAVSFTVCQAVVEQLAKTGTGAS